MKYVKKYGKMVQEISSSVKRPVDNPEVHAIYLAKRRSDKMNDIEIQQQELADIEAEITSFTDVSDLHVMTPEEFLSQN